MPRRMHPFVMNLARSRPEGDILFNQAEMRARLSGPVRKVRLAAVAMAIGPSAAMRRQCWRAASAKASSHCSRPAPDSARDSLARANNCSATRHHLPRSCGCDAAAQRPANEPSQHQTQNQTIDP